ncbi:hypothetical protein B0H12DRAFT_1071370 [Mycena haematopus]|nr:hypothetical protein B0H12DRAFT_1071370 [Mycena haematopus]
MRIAPGRSMKMERGTKPERRPRHNEDGYEGHSTRSRFATQIKWACKRSSPGATHPDDDKECCDIDIPIRDANQIHSNSRRESETFRFATRIRCERANLMQQLGRDASMMMGECRDADSSHVYVLHGPKVEHDALTAVKRLCDAETRYPHCDVAHSRCDPTSVGITTRVPGSNDVIKKKSPAARDLPDNLVNA